MSQYLEMADGPVPVKSLKLNQLQELADEIRRQRRVGHHMAEHVRYGERSTAERVNGGLKDNHGGRTVRVRGPEKVMCHLMFGILSFTVLQLLRLVT